jgi:DNA-binding transcriptional ArsR family regulator
VTLTTHPVSRFDWERVIRRAHLPTSTKAVAWALATYSDEDGTSIHPGEIRLARVVGMAPRNVRKHISRLRDLGLLMLVSRADRFRGKADEHRLTVPEGAALEALALLDPNENHRTLTSSDPVDNSVVRGSQDPVTGHDTPSGTHGSPDVSDGITGRLEQGSEDPSVLPPTHIPTTDQPTVLSSPTDVQSAVAGDATSKTDFDYSTAQQIVQAALGIEQAAARIRELTADGTDYTAAMVTLAHQIGDKPA